MMFGLVTPSRRFGPGRAPVLTDEHCRAYRGSEERSQDLLRQWLSPDQVDQYDTYWRFDVVGSDTGTRYRIRRGTVMNIEELTRDGYVARRWCFAPEGSLAICDVMLAQKIALETNALAIANHDGPQGPGFRRSFLHRDELGLLVLAFAGFVTLVWSFFRIVF